MVQFFDLITFFGVASFFAWLAFARLSDGDISRLVWWKQQIGRDNLCIINDYFLVSFVFWCITAVADYAYHCPKLPIANTTILNHNLVLLVLVGIFSLFGLFTIVHPMIYIRQIGKGANDISTIKPAPVADAIATWFLSSICALALVFMAAYGDPSAKTVEVLSSVLLAYGTYLSLVYWKEEDRLNNIGFWLMVSPIIFYFVYYGAKFLVPLLHRIFMS